MKLRVSIAELNDSTRISLTRFIESLGHEVVSTTLPEICSHYEFEEKQCPQKDACADLFIFGPDFVFNQIELLERMMAGGCKVFTDNTAVMQPSWSIGKHKRALKLGCQFLHLPFECSEFFYWFSQFKKGSFIDREILPSPKTTKTDSGPLPFTSESNKCL